MKLDHIKVPHVTAPGARESSGARPDPAARPEPATKLADGSSSAASQKAQALQQPRPEDLTEVVQKMNETVRIFNRALEFKVSDNGRVVVKVVDMESGDVIREIPPETMVDMFDRLDQMLGVLVDRKV